MSSAARRRPWRPCYGRQWPKTWRAAHATTAGAVTATRSYSFAGKAVAERTAKSGVSQLTVILSDRVNTGETMVLPTTATAGTTALVRFTDPYGLARGPTQSAVANAAFVAAPAGARGVGSNAANPAGFGAVNGYIGKLADSQSKLVQVGARELDPTLGVFTAPDPILERSDQRLFSPYMYSGADPINFSDPSGLFLCDVCNGYESRPNVPINHTKGPIKDYGKKWEQAQYGTLTVAPGGPGNYYYGTNNPYWRYTGAATIGNLPTANPVKKVAEQTAKSFVHNATEVLSWVQDLACNTPNGVCAAVTVLYAVGSIADNLNENPNDVGGALARGLGGAVLGGIPVGGKALKAGMRVAKATEKVAARSVLDGAKKVSGKFPRSAEPNQTLFRQDPSGRVTSYQVYGSDGLPSKRVDVTGRPHGPVPTPHVLEFRRDVNPNTGETFIKPDKNVRAATPEELNGLP